MENLTLSCIHRVSDDRKTQFLIVRVDGMSMIDPEWSRKELKRLEALLMTRIVLAGPLPIDRTTPPIVDWKVFGEPSLGRQVKNIDLNLVQWQKRTWAFGQEPELKPQLPPT
jgi:hypothetical protein